MFMNKNVNIKKEAGHHGDVAKQKLFPSESSFIFATKNAETKYERKKLVCTQCGFKCLTKVLMTSHTVMAHGGHGPGVMTARVTCQECPAVFLSDAGLKTHLVLMHKKDKDTIFQPYVESEEEYNGEEEEYDDNSRMDYFNVEDGDDGNYEDDMELYSIFCRVCQYRTTTLSQLQKHMDLFHQDQVPMLKNFFLCH
jgi:hypothetical protein